MRSGSAITASVLALAIGAAGAAPAQADGSAATRNILLGAAAIAAGVVIESNVARKNHAANTVVGYLPDGATVYQDQRVVEPNGQSYYPADQGEQLSCDGQRCSVSGNGDSNYQGAGVGYQRNHRGYYGYTRQR